MTPDIRHTPRFRDIERRYSDWLRPGSGTVVDLTEIAPSPDGRWAAAAGTVADDLNGIPATRIVLADLADGSLRTLTAGPNSDRSPRWSPDGSTLAFLSDRDQPYVFRLHLLDPTSGADRVVTGIDGWVERHQWSADGKRLLLSVAGFGADLAGAQGGFSVAAKETDKPSWLPSVDAGVADDTWRSVWLYELEADRARRISPPGANVWEACWCGPDAFAAICSDAPGEEAWYGATLRHFPVAGGTPRVLYVPADQLGWLSASPSGARVAVVEAVCSDRTIVAGDLKLIGLASGTAIPADTLGADVTSTAWQGENHLLLTAARGAENLILLHAWPASSTEVLWSGIARTPAGARFAEASPLGDRPGDCLFMREGWFDAPALVAIERREEREIRRFGADGLDPVIEALGSAEALTWPAPDGLEIGGWLLTPLGTGPHPLVLHIHGGPVWFFRPRYLGRTVMHQALLEVGYAILEVNPRGSSGRGQDYARRVFGDMGGADTHDYLSGIDRLVARGIADPARIGVTGGSYGGYMSSWLISQDDRFAAAVPVAPVTNWVSEHLTCHIPFFCKLFLADDMGNPSGKYFTRSPIHHAARVKTPTLNIAGALDKNTPAGQAIEFHHALSAQGTKSALVIYPEEGHGVRRMPAVFDYLARLVDWFEAHMPAG